METQTNRGNAKVIDAVRDIFKENHRRYGYRGFHLELMSEGVTITEKVIIRLMKEPELKMSLILARKYKSYRGKISARLRVPCKVTSM